MFDWLKSKSVPNAPAQSEANPGQGVELSISFSRDEKTWTEEVNLLACLSNVLRVGGYSFSTGKTSIQLESGLVLLPGFVSFQPMQQGGVQTLTTIEVSHAAGIPAGVFEFQHSTGDDTVKSLAGGFEGWMQLELPVFLDSLRAKPEKCTFLEFDLPANGDTPARKRRVVLGPASHYAAQPGDGQKEEHPFCPCCLFTRSLEGMKPKIHDDRFFGVRMFATRNHDGTPMADCRLNGLDWEPGKKALIEYVRSWPNRGLEFRKQYVAIRTVGS